MVGRGKRVFECVPGKQMMKRRAKWAAYEAVLSNPDLVAHILSGTIGPSTYVAASLVSKAWRDACRAEMQR